MKKAISKKHGRIIIPGATYPWPHEMRVARILSDAGNVVEFIPRSSVKTADILLNGVEFEIKSPMTDKTNSLEHILKKGLKQSSNLLIDSSRLENSVEQKLFSFLTSQARKRTRLKRLLFITKSGKIVDIK